jgi:transcriptional regulator GlxA family with amidase domain
LRPQHRNMHPHRCYHSQQERQCPCEGGQQHDQHHNAGGIPNDPPDQANQGLRIIRSDLGRSLYSSHVAALFLCVETWRTRRRAASLFAQGGRTRVQESCPVDTTRPVWLKETRHTAIHPSGCGILEHLQALRCFKWVTQREVMYAGVGSVRLGSWSLAAVR